MEALLATAFEAHPYRNMPGGWASDIENFRLTEAIAFYKKYYVPANITIAIAGDVDPKECRRLADKYFSILPSGPLPSGPRTVEPVAERRKARGGGIARAALYGDRLQAARSERQRRSGVRRAGRDSGRRAHRPAVHGTGSRQENRAGRGRRSVVPRRQISEPVSVLPGAESRPHGGGKREGVLPDHRASEDAKGHR